ncbi:MAG TPA: proline dehydrogenase family protein, partial [Gemmatimonadales bacterium]|nr:proline dehydrogenase family protein [Gemmatimonadales bacterium]
MLRAGLLWLSEQPRIFRFVRSNGLARRFAARFVAGETVETGVAALRQLNAAGITGTLDLLGEAVRTAAEAGAARDTYLATLDRIQAVGAAANVSVKLTQMGLDLDPELCVAHLSAILERAQTQGSFVRIDMEQSDYTERTLHLFKQRFHPAFG